MSDKVDHGGFAFPAPEIRAPNGSVLSAGQDGMSLRDWFAGQAMQGICCHPDNWGLTPATMGATAYEIADVMISARKGGPEVAPDLLSLAYQYRDDLRHPPAQDSRERRLKAIEDVIAKAEGRS